MDSDALIELAQSIERVLVEREPLWTIADIAEHAKKSPSTIKTRYLTRPDFPKSCDPGDPRYIPKEVRDWFQLRKWRH